MLRLNSPNAARASAPGMAKASAGLCASALISCDDSRDSAIAVEVRWVCNAGVVPGWTARRKHSAEAWWAVTAREAKYEQSPSGSRPMTRLNNALRQFRRSRGIRSHLHWSPLMTQECVQSVAAQQIEIAGTDR